MMRAGHSQGPRVIGLEYHDVVGADEEASGFPGEAANSYKLSATRFADHLKALAQRGSAVGPVSSVHATMDKPLVLLTFDDGGLSAAHETRELLGVHGFPGHFFVTTGRIGTPGFCGATELRRLADLGHVIGSHSVSHPTRMSILSRAALEREWRESRETLEDILGRPVDTASVPGGYYARHVAEAAADVGVRFLFTSEPVTALEEVQGCLVIGRYTLRRWSTSAQVVQLTGASGLARLLEKLRWDTKKIVKRVAGRPYLALREGWFNRSAG
jgi:peptidoglycan/xylan/chitin deacetylase (PgdA/CDA1 family)